MNIAVFFEGDIYNPRGEFMAIHNRLRNYTKDRSVKVDAFVCWPNFGKLAHWLLRDSNREKVSHFSIDEIVYQCVWYDRSLVDAFTHKVFKRSCDNEYNSLLNSVEERLKAYDLISAHSLKTARIARYLNKKYNNPFVVTWHGSSIHTLPFIDKNWYKQTAEVLTYASHNFFVSRELQDIANTIAVNKGSISLNGIDESRFFKYTTEQRLITKEKLHIDNGSKNIAFIGNCYPVKNIGYLPILFKKIYDNVSNSRFYIVGDGFFREYFSNYKLPITYLGNISNSLLPDYYNSFDLVVLPSLREGLPMTCLESIACGTHFIGSRVGEIENVVGQEYTIPRDENFDDAFAERCVSVLLGDSKIPPLSGKFLAKNIAAAEVELFKELVNV